MHNQNYSASVIIVSYNNFEGTTGPCLESLKLDEDFQLLEIIIVDNDSDEATKSQLRKYNLFKNIRIVFNESNDGFAKANNLALRMASSEVLILLNSDTFVSPGSLRKLINAIKNNPDWGAVGPMTNAVGNEQLLLCNTNDKNEIFKESEKWLKASVDSKIATNQLSFFCVAFSRNTLNEVGYLDESFGLGYYEDVDFCIRIRNLQRKIYLLEDVFVYHRGSSSFSKVPQKTKELMKANRKKLLIKHPDICADDLIHLREANFRVMKHYISKKSSEGNSYDYRFQKRLEIAQRENPRGLIKKISYKRKLAQLIKDWKTVS